MLEKSVGCVIFRRDESKILYLLLHYPHDHWDYAKGHVEKDEKEVETAIREVEEETGITDLRFAEGFREVVHYMFRRKGRLVRKSVVFLLAETFQEDVKTSFEHKAFRWLPFDRALEQLTFKNAKDVITKAHEHLKTNPSITQFTGD